MQEEEKMKKQHCYVTAIDLRKGYRVDYTKVGGISQKLANSVARGLKKDMKTAIPKYQVFEKIKVECRKH